MRQIRFSLQQSIKRSFDLNSRLCVEYVLNKICSVNFFCRKLSGVSTEMFSIILAAIYVSTRLRLSAFKFDSGKYSVVISC